MGQREQSPEEQLLQVVQLVLDATKAWELAKSGVENFQRETLEKLQAELQKLREELDDKEHHLRLRLEAQAVLLK